MRISNVFACSHFVPVLYQQIRTCPCLVLIQNIIKWPPRRDSVFCDRSGGEWCKFGLLYIFIGLTAIVYSLTSLMN